MVATVHGSSLNQDISNAFITTRKNAGIDKEITFHSLRHNFCTRALESGMDLKDVKELAVHASIAITLDRYGHVLEENAISEMDNLYRAMRSTD